MNVTGERYSTNDSDLRETNLGANSIDDKIGEVQTSPSDYTVLQRLKLIADKLGDTGTNDTAIQLLNAIESAIVTKLDLSIADLDILLTLIGEVQATPTVNTVLDRLKVLADKTGEVQAIPSQYTTLARLRDINTSLSNIYSNTTYGIGSTSQLYTRATEFEISCEITRPANTTAYSTNQIINTDALAYLPTLDFSAFVSSARSLQINSVTLLSSYGSATTKLTPIIHLFNTNTITGQSVVDATTFNPTYAELKAKRVMTFESCTNLTTHGNNGYTLSQTEIMRNCKLDSNGRLYVALVTNGSYTPASNELITIQIKGYLL